MRVQKVLGLISSAKLLGVKFETIHQPIMHYCSLKLFRRL